MLTKRIFKAIFAGLISLASVHNSSATLLVSDHFDYADGDLLTVSGGSWIKSSGTTALNISSGNAIVTTSASDDDGRPFAPVGSGVLYYGLTANITSVPGTSGSYIAAFWDGETAANTDFFGRLQVAQGSTATKVKFGIINDSVNVPVYFTASEFDLNTSIQIVVKFDFSTMTSTLWINPTDESSASVTDPVAAIFTGPSTTLGNILLRQASGIGTTAVDYVSAATTFGEVLAVPEPAVIWLFLGGAASVALFATTSKRLIRHS